MEWRPRPILLRLHSHNPLHRFPHRLLRPPGGSAHWGPRFPRRGRCPRDPASIAPTRIVLVRTLSAATPHWLPWIGKWPPNTRVRFVSHPRNNAPSCAALRTVSMIIATGARAMPASATLTPDACARSATSWQGRGNRPDNAWITGVEFLVVTLRHTP